MTSDKLAEATSVANESRPIIDVHGNFTQEIYPYVREKDPIYKLLINKLFGGRLLDLGAGRSAETMGNFAQRMGVKEFIAVDKDYQPSLGNEIVENYRTQKGDMLVFLAEQADSSANITLNSTDDTLSTMPVNYQNILVREMARVIGNNGIAFGFEASEAHILNMLTAYGYKTEVVNGITVIGRELSDISD